MAVVVSTTNGDRLREGCETPPKGRRASGDPASGASASSLLEYSQNVVTTIGTPPEEFQLSPCGCDCWFCPDCCERKGYNLRARLIPVLETFTGLMMLTLTIDPELFESPQEAYLHVKKKRGISRLMRELDRRGHLHTRRYFYVVEFQHQTEQAHFHVLVDATRIPKTHLDLAWSKLRPKSAGEPSSNRPAFGTTRFSKGSFDGGGEHAGKYATKYLVKVPEHGWPGWVLGMGKEFRVQRYQTSRGFWGNPKSPKATTGKKRKLIPVSYAERIQECGSMSNLFWVEKSIDPSTGEEVRRLRWKERLIIDASILRHFMPKEGNPKRPRVNLNAMSHEDAIARISAELGIPVRLRRKLQMLQGDGS